MWNRSMITITKMRHSQIKEVQALVAKELQRKIGRHPIQSKGTTSFIACNGKEIIGHILVQIHYDPIRNEKKLLIDDFVVKENYQKEGIGTKLMGQVFSYAKEKKISTLQLTSRPQRIAAHHLYQKLGFEKVETTVFRKNMKK